MINVTNINNDKLTGITPRMVVVTSRRCCTFPTATIIGHTKYLLRGMQMHTWIYVWIDAFPGIHRPRN